MSVSKEDPSVFVVGTESGGVMKCSTLSKEIPMDRGRFPRQEEEL